MKCYVLVRRFGLAEIGSYADHQRCQWLLLTVFIGSRT